MKILVLGSKGQLGRSLYDQIKSTKHETIFTSREQIDVSNFEDTKNQILKICPEVVINASAYTAVDKAEEDKQTANTINHLAIDNISKICKQLDCWLIHFSTDYIFDGNSNVPYKEQDRPNPQCVYGETKLKGELAVNASGCKHIIIRTAWVFSEYGNNFLVNILRLGAKLNELKIIDDQFGCPTYAQDIAKAVIIILERLDSSEEIVGTYHYSGESSCSWYEFANEIFKQSSRYNKFIAPSLKKISSEEYITLAKRPSYSVLDTKKIYERFNIIGSNWKQGVTKILKKGVI